MNAVVFAYHDVGVRCLKVLLARGIRVSLVVTHEDNPNENIWFASVAETCREYGITFVTPEDPNSAKLLSQVQAAKPDFIFSFYYRHMLPVGLLSEARYGAYNMHGSLLPKYRGRVPINWAVLHGETETGATLHEMAAKPDAGAIVAQTAVPILPDDTAHEVFCKVVVAAEQTLWNVLPAMLAGRTPKLPNDLSKGSYFGGRKPEDGRIDWKNRRSRCIIWYAPWRHPIRAPSKKSRVIKLRSQEPDSSRLRPARHWNGRMGRKTSSLREAVSTRAAAMATTCKLWVS